MRATRRGDDPVESVVVGNAGVDTNVYLDRDDVDPDVDGHFTRNIDYAGQAGGFPSGDTPVSGTGRPSSERRGRTPRAQWS